MTGIEANCLVVHVAAGSWCRCSVCVKLEVNHRSENGAKVDSPLVLFSSVLHLNKQLVQSASRHRGYAHYLQTPQERPPHFCWPVSTSNLHNICPITIQNQAHPARSSSVSYFETLIVFTIRLQRYKSAHCDFEAASLRGRKTTQRCFSISCVSGGGASLVKNNFTD